MNITVYKRKYYAELQIQFPSLKCLVIYKMTLSPGHKKPPKDKKLFGNGAQPCTLCRNTIFQGAN